MARYTRTPVSTLQGINNELAKVELAMEDTLDRKGVTPNYMDANLDMNSRRILNLPAPLTDQEPLRKGDIPTGLSVSSQYVDDKFIPTSVFLKSQGLSGNYGFFEKGFTYSEEGDAGVDSEGNIWTYNGALPFEVDAGTNPAEDDNYARFNYNQSSHVFNDDDSTSQDDHDSLLNLKSQINPLTGEVVVFIVYGQSNARGSASNTPGRLPITDAAKYWSRAQQEITQMTYEMESAWAVDGVNSSGHAWGAFANRFNQLTGLESYWVPGAIGGKSLTELSKGAAGDGIYEALKTEYDKFIIELASNGLTPSSVNVVFHQGETDQRDEVSWDDYYALLNTLFANMRSDFDVDNFFIATVGNPQSRKETTWAVIRNAQEYVAYRADDITIAYSDFKFFTQTNGLLRSDGVHATQRGYNRMGFAMADSVVQSMQLDIAAGYDEVNFKSFDHSVVSSNEVKSVHAVVDLNETRALLLTRDDTTNYISSHVTGVSLTEDHVVIECEGLRNHYIYDIQVTVYNRDDKEVGVFSSGLFGEVGNNKLGILVNLSKDLYCSVQTNTGSEGVFRDAVAPTRPVDIFKPDEIDFRVETNYIAIDHQSTRYPRLACLTDRTLDPNTTRGLTITQPSSTETRLPRDEGWINLVIPSMKINPSNLADGSNFRVHVSAKATNQAV